MSADPEIGYPFNINNNALSPVRVNAKTFLIAPASYLNSLDLTALPAGQAVHCIGTASIGIFKPNRTYFLSADRTHFQPSTGIIHYHDDETEDAGGRYRKI